MKPLALNGQRASTSIACAPLLAHDVFIPRVVLIYRQGRAIDGSLFADVAREFKSSERTVNGLYYDPAMRWLRRLAKKKTPPATGQKTPPFLTVSEKPPFPAQYSHRELWLRHHPKVMRHAECGPKKKPQ